MTYQEVAVNIIKDSIKSAVFIDENAKEPYSTDNPSEEVRTIELYKQFRKDGISLSVFKYNNDYRKQVDYLFVNRDLVLLDWKLEGDEKDGEKSLEILSEIVNNHNNIHFCVIYTNEEEDSVLNNILSYFSETSRLEYEDFKLDLLEKEDEIKEILSDLEELSLYRFEPNLKEKYNNIRRKNSDVVNFIHDIIKANTKQCSLIKCGIAYNNYIKSEDKQPCPSSIDIPSYTLCINNTIISILSKKIIDPNHLFEKFANAIANYNCGIMHLIGLELKSIQKRKDSYIDADILKVTKKALGYHKSEKENEFDSFLKEVMLEQEALNLRDEKLTLIDAIDNEQYEESLKDEYLSMNVFYNSAHLNSQKTLSFGDVFKCGNSYYICITALCDCLRPSKRNNKFYFAEGKEVSTSKGMKIGDSGFVSFVFDEHIKCIKWNDRDEIDEPTYIIPETYLVPDNMINENKLNVQKALKQNNEQWVLQNFTFEYITTIKQNYAQRIANHAFTHPVRVGVDFIGKTND